MGRAQNSKFATQFTVKLAQNYEPILKPKKGNERGRTGSSQYVPLILQLCGNNGKYGSNFIYNEIFVSSVLGKSNYHRPSSQCFREIGERDVRRRSPQMRFLPRNFKNNKMVVFFHSFANSSPGTRASQVLLSFV